MYINSVFKQDFLKFISTIIFVFAINLVFSQNWKSIKEDDSYKIEKQHVICKSNQGFDYEYVLLKYTNKTNQKIDLSYNLEVWYETVCEGCEDPDAKGLKTISIPAKSSIIGSCDSRSTDLKIFDHSITIHPNAFKSTLTEIKFVEVVVNK